MIKKTIDKFIMRREGFTFLGNIILFNGIVWLSSITNTSPAFSIFCMTVAQVASVLWISYFDVKLDLYKEEIRKEFKL